MTGFKGASAFVANALLWIRFPSMENECAVRGGAESLWLVISFAEVFPVVLEREARKIRSGQVDPEGLKQRQMSDCLRFIARVLCFLSGLVVYSPTPKKAIIKKRSEPCGEEELFSFNVHRTNNLTPVFVNQMEFKSEVNSITQPVFLILLLSFHRARFTQRPGDQGRHWHQLFRHLGPCPG